jgi:hypothetical protein
MSSITILGGDFEILFDDEKNQNGGTAAVAGMRTIQHTGASETVYTTNQLYSAVADAADEFVAMGFRNPMLPVTPNAYTMENQYFIPRSSTQYLKEGAITADWSLTGTVAGDGVAKVNYVDSVSFVSGDIGRQVTQSDSGDTGTLLDFDIDQDGSLAAWIRPDDPATDTFSGTGSISVTADGGGTGSSTSSTAGVNGEHIFSAIQAIGSVPTATEVYLIQDRQKISSWDDSFQWWATDADASLGIISILIQVKDSGTLVADGDVEVFARRYTALYDNFRLNVAGGGFSALPLASAPDINNTTGYRTFTGDTLTGSGTFTVGNGIYDASAGSFANATKKGVITAVSGTATEPVIEYYLVGDLTDFVVSDTIQEYDYSTGLDGDADIAGSGILAPSNTSGGPADTGAGEGGSLTITLEHSDVDHDGNGTPEPYSVTVDCQGDVPIAKVYENIKYVCRRGQDNSFWDTNSSNMPGETYRGLDTFVEWDNPLGGAMTDGENVTGASGYTARLAGYSTSSAWASPVDYITLSDSQTSLDSVADGNTITGVTSGGSVDAIGTGGTYNIVSFTSPKASPFGTFTGSQIFGARGVAFINPDGADVQAYILTDDIGTLNTPPNTVSFTVSNTAALDRILVARDTGTSGIIDKDQFGGMTAASAGDSTITVGDGSFNEQIPPVGFVRVVDTDPLLSRLGNTDTQQEHKYEYSSRAGGTGVFTLTAVDNATGTATGGSTTTLVDSGGGFQGTVPVKVGMLVRNTTDGGIFEVTEVTSDTTLAVQQLYGTAGGDFANLDGYEINRVITAYTTDDDIYDLILDIEATGSSVTNSFTKTLSSNFGVVVNVRQGKIILPFTLNQTQGDGSTSVTVVRQPDNIAT